MDLNKCLKVLNSEQIRQADQFTIKNEPIASLDLMERASETFVDWFLRQFPEGSLVRIICGTGNNGGDGLVIARLLLEYNFEIEVFVVGDPKKGSRDFQINYELVQNFLKPVRLTSEKKFPVFTKNEILIDAMFGSGLSRPVKGIYAKLIEHINNSPCDRIAAVDIASGLGSNEYFKGGEVLGVSHTVSFQVPKLSLMLPQNEAYAGEVFIEDIGLNQEFISALESNHLLVTLEFVRSILKERPIFSHKGKLGKVLLYAGSAGKMGAAILAAKACKRAGVGLLSMYVPESENVIAQLGVPEAMAICYSGSSEQTDFHDFDCMGVGPGIGVNDTSRNRLEAILKNAKGPMVLDADALNLMSIDKTLISNVPKNSIITPHPGEFERLVGEWKDDYHRLELQQQLSKKHNLIVLLKGANTSIASPDGKVFFNSTGNSGMATGGSGDVLTGIVTGLLAQGYLPLEAAILGAFVHGLAGDHFYDEYGPESLVASDLIAYLPTAFQTIRDLAI